MPAVCPGEYMKRFYVFNPGTREPLRVRAEGVQFSDGGAMCRWMNSQEDVPQPLLDQVGQSKAYSFGPYTLDDVLATWGCYAVFIDTGDEDDGLLEKLSDPRMHEAAAVDMAVRQQVKAAEEVTNAKPQG